MLKLENIELSLPEQEQEGKVTVVLKGINLELEQGKFYAITGPNGSGKTSLAKVIMGIYQPTGGRLWWEGEEITHLSITERARRGIGYAFQQPPRFKGITVLDLLRLAAGENDVKKMCWSLRSVGLCPEDYLRREVDSRLSGGEMKRIEIATLLLRPARLVVYDEPEAGVDLWSFEELLKVLQGTHQRTRAATVVITHHERILTSADEIILMAEGAITAKGRPSEIWPLITDRDACRWRKTCRGENDDSGCY